MATRPIKLTHARNVGLTALAMASGYLVVQNILFLVKADPFREMRGIDAAKLPGIEMRGVELKHFKDGKLVTGLHADKVDVSQDRREFSLSGLKNGKYLSDQGLIKFDATKGVYGTSSQILKVDAGAHVLSNNFDVRSSSLSLDRRKNELRIPTPITGKLYGGELVASDLTYHLKSGDAESTLARWKGKVSKLPGAPQDEITAREWQFRGRLSRKQGKDYVYNGRAEDGEVILIAPQLVRDLKTDVLTATGRVTYYSGKANLIADKVVVYRKEKRAIFSGNVVLLVKPKKDQDQKPSETEIRPFTPELPTSLANSNGGVLTEEEKKRDDELRSGKTVRDFPMSVTATEITYFYRKGQRRAKILGQPHAYQTFGDGRWRDLVSNNADYDGEKDTLQLNSAPGKREAHVKNSIGDDLTASMLRVSTKEDQTDETEEIDGEDITGKFVDRNPDEDPRGGKAKPDPKAPSTKIPPAKIPPPLTGPFKTKSASNQ